MRREKYFRNVLLILAWGMLMPHAGFAEREYSAYKKEIKELEEKIAKTMEDIKSTETKIKSDEKEFAEYCQWFKKNYEQQKVEAERLESDKNTLEKTADSMLFCIHAVRQSQKNSDLTDNRFRLTLINSCDSIKALILYMPPSRINETLNPLSFLRSEIVAGSVGTIEAIERLWQIIGQLSAASQDIEVYSAPSPVSEIKGNVNFIRISNAYLAFVNEKATAGAIWIKVNEKNAVGQWNIISDASKLMALNKCVQIRQGRAVPELISIPFDSRIISDTLNLNGGGP